MKSARWVVLCFLAIALFEAGKDYLSAIARGRPEPLVMVVLGSLEWWGTWALLTPLCAALTRRLGRLRSRPLLLLGQLAGGAACCALHLTLIGLLYFTTHTRHLGHGALAQIRAFFNGYLMLDVITYLTIIGGCVALDLYRRNQEGERRVAGLRLQAAQLESRMAEAQLQALRMELHPHFLFNTLNAACGLIRRREPDAAVRVLELLSVLLRATLARGQAAEVSLRQELELLGAYLEIERTRFPDRLQIHQAIDPAAQEAQVPPLLLQPIVENAVRHGVAPVRGPGRVEIRAQVSASGLRVVVEDSGPGFPEPRLLREGIGLQNTRARLAQMYGAAARLELANVPAGGARVTLTLPLRREEV